MTIKPSLHDKIIAEAPVGFTVRPCPGAFDAYIAKSASGDVVCRYVGKNDSPERKRWVADRVKSLVVDFDQYGI